MRIGLGDVLLLMVRNTPLTVLGSFSRATVVLVLPLEGGGAMSLNSLTLRQHGVGVYGAGAKFEAASSGDCLWAAVVLPSATASILLGQRRLPATLRPYMHALLSASPIAWTRAAALTRDAFEVATQDPDVFEVEEARRALRFALLEISRELMNSPLDEEAARSRKACSVHRRLVRQADDWTTIAPNHAAGMTEMASALGVSERQLREAFASVLGVSPSRYLRLRRLVLARAALRSPGLSWSSVREVALAHGFWHFGRFAFLYRDAFGESPSTTLGRASHWASMAPAKSSSSQY
jgi:AraC-like DNA-binding protein